MQTLVYLLQLFLSLAIGALVAFGFGKERFHLFTHRLLDIALYALLFLMGVNTSQIPDIRKNLATIGVDALVATVCITIGVVISSALLALLLSHRVSKKERVRQKLSLSRLRTPLTMIGAVALGIILGATTTLFSWFESSLISYVLFGLLFFVGMQMVQQEIKLLPLLKSPLMILLPISTIVGTYIGAIGFSLVSSYSIVESCALASGFGWYSLSGVMISSLGYPTLGTLSFLSNLFRETFSFVLIPFLATLSGASFSSISLAGATSMDVTLPVLKKSLGESVIPLAISHGVILTFVAPFIIPLWFV
jgi:uncharacterized membrane protein YbjE (DUF340 family)